MRFKKIGYIADDSEKALEASKLLTAQFDLVKLSENSEKVDFIIVLGGDGFMLHSMHKFLDWKIPFYGMNTGSVGFLMNEFLVDGLFARLKDAISTYIHPLSITATNIDNEKFEVKAINEVSLYRANNQASCIKITIDEALCIEQLICDGVLVSTPAGSSAYNFSAGGPILPLNANILALTPISPFRPRRWRGALLPNYSKFRFDILNHNKRPVNLVADFHEVQNIIYAEVTEDKNTEIELMFDPEHSLESRIIKEQFMY